MKRWLLAAALLSSLVCSGIAHGALITYALTLSGPAESPPNASTGTGTATLEVDLLANTLGVDVVFSGLTSGTTASHIHCCTSAPFTGTAGVATAVPTFPGFPLGVTSGTYHQVFDLGLASTYNPTFVSNTAGGSLLTAESLLLQGLATGEAYLNIHTTQNPSGEIRSFARLAAVPEPATLALLGAALAAAPLVRRRRA